MGERRVARRYDLSLPVAVRTAHFAEPQTGKTRDISTRGVYLTLNETLATGSELDFTLKLPSQSPDTDVLVQARGHVVRVESNPTGSPRAFGVAAVIEKFEIVRAEQKHN